jgi:hypothetical protein
MAPTLTTLRQNLMTKLKKLRDVLEMTINTFMCGTNVETIRLATRRLLRSRRQRELSVQPNALSTKLW